MNESNEDTSVGSVGDLAIRPVLILSPEEAKEYQVFINNTLLGLAERSVYTAVVAERQTLKRVSVKYACEVVIHPQIELPLIKRRNFDLLSKSLESINPTIVHCFGQSKAGLARHISNEMSIPFILSFYSPVQMSSAITLRSKRLSRIIVPSMSIYDQSVKSLFGHADNIGIIRPGIFAKEHISSFNRSAKLTNIAIYGGDTIGDISVLGSVFGAIRHLFIDGYEFFIVIIDAGGAERKLRRVIEELGISHLCTFLTNLDSYKVILNETDIFINTGIQKNFNAVLLEVMGNGVAVITVKDNCDDLIEDEKNAFVFEPTDELSIYAPLQRLLDDRVLARELAENGRKLVEEQYTVSSMVDSTIQSYRDAIISADSSVSNQ